MDSLSNFISILQTNQTHKNSVAILPYSKLSEQFLKVLRSERLINGYTLEYIPVFPSVTFSRSSAVALLRPQKQQSVSRTKVVKPCGPCGRKAKALPPYHPQGVIRSGFTQEKPRLIVPSTQCSPARTLLMQANFSAFPSVMRAKALCVYTDKMSSFPPALAKVGFAEKKQLRKDGAILSDGTRFDFSEQSQPCGCKAKALPPLLGRSGFTQSLGKRKISTESIEKENYQWKKKNFLVSLKYEQGIPALQQCLRISTPGRRIYCNTEFLNKHKKGFYLLFLSTSYGIISHTKARALGVGGELLCKISL